MFVFRFHALPDPNADLPPEGRGAAGAYASVWINFAEQVGAELVARHYVQERGWLILELEDVRIPSRSDYEEHEAALRYFDEAAKYGYCVSVHLYERDEGQ